MKVFFIVGEDSGDALAAPLIAELKEQYGEDAECMGVGGPMMEEEGYTQLLPMDQISVIGIWEVLPKIPRLLKLRKAIIEEIEAQQPDAVVTVDFPDFNFSIAKSLKKRGVFKGKLIHYVAPSVWAWRPGRAQKIAQFMDAMMCLFPMEVDYFTQHGMKAEHVGHPLICSGAKEASLSEFKAANDIPPEARTIGLFFGSRESEFKKLSPIIKHAAQMVGETEGNIHIIVPTLSKMEYEIQQLLQDFPFKVYVTSNPNVKWEAFKACDMAIAVSGTVALELAYIGVPHLVIYKVNPVTALILRLMIKVKFVHLANILLNKSVVPECLQAKCNPVKIAEEAVELLNNIERKNEQIQDFKRLGILLGEASEKTPPQRAAQFISSVINQE